MPKTLIESFKPPVIKKAEIERGVRYLPESPEQIDPLGQVLNVGDLVIYGGSGDTSGNLRFGKIVGIYTRITPPRWEGQAEYVETKLSVALTSRWYGNRITRQSTDKNSMVKVNESIFATAPDTLKALKEC
jgi:hypothetical protein